MARGSRNGVSLDNALGQHCLEGSLPNSGSSNRKKEACVGVLSASWKVTKCLVGSVECLERPCLSSGIRLVWGLLSW